MPKSLRRRLLAVILFTSSWAAYADEPRPDAPLGAGVQFLVQLKTGNNDGCVLLEQTQGLESKSGAGSVHASAVNCGNIPHMAYDPTSRLQFQIYFKDEGARDWQPLNTDAAKVLPVLLPMAVEAAQLGGYSARNFLRFDSHTAEAPVSATELTLGDYKELIALVHGTSTNYTKSSEAGVVLPSVAGQPIAPVPGQIWYDSQAKTVRIFTGSGVGDLHPQPQPPPNCCDTCLKSITAGTGLTGGTITQSGTIALENFGTAGTFYKVVTDAKGRVKSGSTSLVESDIPTLQTPGKVLGGAIVSGTIGGSTNINTTGTVTANGISAGIVSAQVVRIYDSSNSHDITLGIAGRLPSSFTLTLPNTLPSKAGEVLTSDTQGHLSWTIPTGGGSTGSVSVSGVLPIVISGTATAPIVNVTSATTTSVGVVQLATLGGTDAGTAVQGNDPRLNNGRAPSGVAGGDLSGTYPNPTVAKVRGVNVTSTTPLQGETFKNDGTNWAPSFVGVADLKTAVGASQIPTGCTPAQTWSYSSATDQVSCVSIAIPYTAVSGLGNSATKNMGTAAGTVAAGDDSRFGNALQIQGRAVDATAPSAAQVLTWNATTNTWSPANAPSAPVKSVAGKIGTVTLVAGDIGGLGTSAVKDVPATGDAATTQVVLGSDSRLGNALEIQGRPVDTTAPINAQVLTWNASDSKWEPTSAPSAPVTSVAGKKGDVLLVAADIAGLGTAATKDVPASGNAAANQVVLGNDTRFGNALQIQGRTIDTTAPVNAQVLAWNATSSQWEPTTAPSAPVTSVAGRKGDIILTTADIAGLGTSATKDVPASGDAGPTQVVLGSDSRFGNALEIQGRNVAATSPSNTQVLTWNANSNRWEPANVPAAPVTSVAGRTGAITLSASDISGLGTAAVKNVPSTGDAAGDQVVLGNDSRLTASRSPTSAAGGDLTGTYPNPTLVAAGTAGTYIKVTTDTKGRVISGNGALTPDDIPGLDWTKIVSGTPTTLSGYGITDAVLNAGGTPSIKTGLDTAKGQAGTAGRIYVAADTLKIYSDNGSAWTVLASSIGSGGTLTSITAGNGLLGGTITTSGTISANVGTGAGQLVQLDNGAKLPAVDASQVLNLNASSLTTGIVPAARMPALSGDVTSTAGSTSVSVVKIQGNPVTAGTPNAGAYLKYSGSAWTSGLVTLSDLKSTVAGTLFPAPGCSVAQTLSWSSITDQFACQGIHISDSAITYGSESANTFLAAPVGTAGAPTFRTIATTDLPPGAYDSTYFKNGGNSFGAAAVLGTNDAQTLSLKTAGAVRLTLDTAGSVGVGVTSPQAALDVNGAVKVGNDSVCNSAKAGAIRWTGSAFQGCDGTNWSALTNVASQTAPGFGYQVNTTDAVYTATIPWADAIPTTSQGTEILAATITPTSATSLIELNVLVHYSESVNRSVPFVLAAFQDSGTAAFATAASNITSANCGPSADGGYLCQATLSTVLPAGKTGATTFHIRAGALVGSWELNGFGGRKLGGTLGSTLIVREIKM